MKNLLIILKVFLTAYTLASFTAWNIDCREWDVLGRWGVIWGTTVVSVCLIYRNKVL